MKRCKKLRVPILVLILAYWISACNPPEINADRAFGYIETQLSFGYRTPGSQASLMAAQFIHDILEENGWEVEFQIFHHENVLIRNIIAKRDDAPPSLILGTHYDTRMISDNDPVPGHRDSPVPGANDGASGTALLLELSHQPGLFDESIWLVFFDAEDQGGIEGWDWSLGAEYFADHITMEPEKVVIVDMVGDANLNIHKEKNSDQSLVQEIWNIAEGLGYGDSFFDEPKYAMIDDHLPFLDLGIPSALIIDFDYPHWHTTADTLDKVSGESLSLVAKVLLEWITDEN